jgi:hypothetical protein
MTESWARDEVLAAACAAHRILGGYIKHTGVSPPAAGPQLANKTLMREILAGGSSLVVGEDRDLAQAILGSARGLVLRVLAPRVLTDYEHRLWQLVAQEQVAARDLGFCASLPQSYHRASLADSYTQRIQRAQQGWLAPVGARVTVSVEIAQRGYSQAYNTHYITALTPDDRCVFFFLRAPVSAGDRIQIRGTVKEHLSYGYLRGQQYEIPTTRLNRVTVVKALQNA